MKRAFFVLQTGAILINDLDHPFPSDPECQSAFCSSRARQFPAREPSARVCKRCRGVGRKKRGFGRVSIAHHRGDTHLLSAKSEARQKKRGNDLDLEPGDRRNERTAIKRDDGRRRMRVCRARDRQLRVLI